MSALTKEGTNLVNPTAEPAAGAIEPGLRSRRAIWRRVADAFAGAPIWAVLIAVFIAAWIVVSASGNDFVTVDNIRNLLVRSVALGIVAVGQTLVVLGGSLDLSVAYLISVAAIVGGSVMDGQSGNVLPAVLLVLAIGAGVGLVNGLLITRVKVNAFMATLGTALIMRGVLEASTANFAGKAAPGFQDLGYNSIGPVPLALILLALIVAGVWWLLRSTRFGYHLYAVGGDEEAARLSGVRSGRVLVIAHVLCSVLAVVCGLFLLSRVGQGAPWVGPDGRYDLESVAAVVVGGTALAGGRGGVMGTVAGVLILAILDNAFNQVGINGFVKDIVRGAILIAAVAAYAHRGTRREA